MPVVKVLLATLLLVATAVAQDTGATNLTRVLVEKKLTVGKSSHEDTLTLLGNPESVSSTSRQRGRENWIYQRRTSNVSTQTLWLTFTNNVLAEKTYKPR